MAELSVELKGKITDLERKLKKADKLLKNTGAVAEQTSNKVAASNKKTGQSAGGVEKGISQMSSAFLGPAGAVAAGLSLVAVFALLQERGNKVSTALEKISGGVDALTEAQRNFEEATNKGIGSAQAELIVLDQLLEKARDTTKATDERQEALDRLNKKYKDQLGLLTLDSIESEKVEIARLKLGDAMIREAKIRGLTSLIAKESIKILEEEQKSALDAIGTMGLLSAAFRGAVSGNAALLNSLILTGGFKRQGEEIDEARKKMDAYTKQISALLDEDLPFDRVAGPKAKAVELEKFAKINYTDDELGQRFGIDKKAQERLESLAGKVSNKLSIAIAKDLKAEPVKAYLSEIEKSLIEFNEKSRALIEGSITNTFVRLGDAIGNALANGGNILSAVGSTVVAAFGGFLSDMGELMIQYGTLAVTKGILDKVIASGGPQSIVAGAAAIAVGIALSAAGSAIQNRASGGFNGSSSVGGQGSSNGFSGASSQSFTSGGFGGGGKVVFEIAGTKLLGVLRNTQDSNLRLGGNYGN